MIFVLTRGVENLRDDDATKSVLFHLCSIFLIFFSMLFLVH